MSIKKKDFIYLFLKRGEGRKKERERNIHVWLPLMCPPPPQGTWPPTHKQPFGLQASIQSTEPHISQGLRQCFSPFLFPSLPLSLKINKIFKLLSPNLAVRRQGKQLIRT